MALRVLDVFAGLGGFSLGLERTGGFETVAFCEVDRFASKVLNRHWPNVPVFGDVRELTGEVLDAEEITVDVITGGFPCQDISIAGKQEGIGGERSGLWGELHRLIREIRPRYAIVENVSALIVGNSGQWFGRVLGDLAEIGFDAEWHCIPASYLGAPHRRDRVWIVASPAGGQKREVLADALCLDVAGDRGTWKQVSTLGRQPREAEGGCETVRGWGDWATEPDVGRVANGVPNRVDRIRCLGNAVVPQIPEMIGWAILKQENRI